MAGDPENKASWEFEPGPGGSFVVYERPKRDVNDWPPVVCSRNLWPSRAGESHRHGRMIAAAPDYFEAVEMMLLNEQCGGNGWWDGWRALKAAHAKAKGEDAPE